MSRRSRRRFERIHTKRAKAGFPRVSPAILHRDGTITVANGPMKGQTAYPYSPYGRQLAAQQQPQKVIEFPKSYCGNNARWVKNQSWKWWSTPAYYLLLPVYIVRACIYYMRAPRDEWRTWENYVGLAKGTCDARTGRLYKWE